MTGFFEKHGAFVQGHLLIRDPDSGEVIINKNATGPMPKSDKEKVHDENK